MTVNLAFKCDNAAFEESASAEIARILRDLADGNNILASPGIGGDNDPS